MLLISFVGQPLFGATAEEQLRFWRETLNLQNLGEINGRVATAAVRWPKIYSTGRTVYANDYERQRNADYAQLAANLLDTIQRLANTLDGRPAGVIVTSVGQLLATRDWLAGSPSYQNYALIDTINRQALVRLVELLGNPDVDSAEVTRGLKALGEFHFDPAGWRTMLEEEKGATVDDDAREFGVVQKTRQAKMRDRAWARGFDSYRTSILLKEQDFTTLGWRMAGTDYYLSSILPALLEYWQKADAPSVNDDYAKIRSVLGKETLVSKSIGAEFLERSRAAAAVDEILQQVKSHKLRGHVHLIGDLQ